jgi:cytochrome P450
VTPTPGPVDLEYFERHYAIKHLELSEHMWQVVEHLHATCPVAHSDAPTEAGGAARGMWVVTKYEDVSRVLQGWDTFSSDCERLVEAGTYAARLGNLRP